MFPIRLGLASRTAAVNLEALSHVAAAINVQVTRDFGPIWGVTASVEIIVDADKIPVGVWPIFVQDEVDGDYLGIHLDDHNQPYSQVLFGPTWSLTASHECLEMLADPSANRLVSAPSVRLVDNEIADGDAKFEFLVEVCDPCQDPAFAYLIDEILVSDFYTPRYFDPVAATGVRYSFSGKITRPREVLQNGYLSWVNPNTRTLQQAKAYGAPFIDDLGPISLTASARALRAVLDRRTSTPVDLSELPRGSALVAQSQARAAALSDAARKRGAALAPVAAPSQAAATQAHAPAPPSPQQALTKAGSQAFARPGVYSVRPGWLMANNWPTNKPAIVVTVDPAELTQLMTQIPSALDGVPIDIRPANVLQGVQAAAPHQYAVMAEARHELRQPDFPNELRFDGHGGLLAQTPEAMLAASRPRKPQLPYQGPTNATLHAVQGHFSLILHASPDAGWARLAEFLSGTQDRLVVGMYDFTSEHVLEAVETAITNAGGDLTLTLDHPAKNPTADQTDEDTQKALSSTLNARFHGAWALTRGDPKATQWVFPTAYHIKVAVRDDDTTWLSSGNWNNSNQPVIDLSDAAGAKKIAAKSDRDWHVIAKNKELADVFRAYLLNDFDVAHAHNASLQASAFAAASGATALDATTVDVPSDAFAAGRVARKFFPATTIAGQFEVKPLLSPDNYQPEILALIRSARTRFYMQTQYIHPAAGPDDQGHADLIAAVQSLITSGLDVRLITSEFETSAWLEKLKDVGFDISRIRIQPKVHNKGIVVDDDKVVVSSQNWSADGTLRNRDAGLIITSTEAVAYFEQIFLYDWNNLASSRTLS